MQFKEAFNLMSQGKICAVEDMEYQLSSVFPPKIHRRQKGNIDSDWEEIKRLGYLLYTLASDLWEVSNEDN